MPIYEYRCGDCGHELEALQKFSDPKLTTCPECGKEALTKLVSASAFVLKGSGWYATDFRDKDKPKSASKGESTGAEGGSGDKAETKSGGKSESKSESKSDSSGENKTKSEDKKGESKPQKKAAGE